MNAFHFYRCNNGRGVLTSGLALGLASVKSDPGNKSRRSRYKSIFGKFSHWSN